MNRDAATSTLWVDHVITGTGIGGAETLLARLLPALRAGGVQSRVLSLRPLGAVADTIQEAGFEISSLNLTRRRLRPSAPWELRRWLQRGRAQVVQTWLYHADLAGGLAARSLRLPVVWGVHVSDVSAPMVRPSTRALAHVCAGVSGWLPQAVVCCSPRAAQAHLSLGYRASRMRVIPNGVDTHTFAPNPDARQAWRSRLRIPSSAPVIGTVARYHPTKDYPTLIAAIRQHARASPQAHYVAVGPGVSEVQPALRALATELRGRVHLLGAQATVADILNAFDVFTLASKSEAAPMALLEAMATGLPAVVTRAGDMPELLGEASLAVPTGDAPALAEAWSATLAEGSAQGPENRRRVLASYSLTATAAAYAELYRRLGAKAARPMTPSNSSAAP